MPHVTLLPFLLSALLLPHLTSGQSWSPSWNTTVPTCNTTTPLPTVNLTNHLALTPPMGWSSWNYFGPDINETLIKSTIDAMLTNGLHAAGYIYINLDDGWQRYKGRRSSHPLEVDPVKFPSGMKSLADYAHTHGFKLGIYSGPGEKTCAGYTGSAGHAREDAEMFASWGIDHLKYDSCCSHASAPQSEVQSVMLDMSTALLATDRGIVFHACHCGWTDIWTWAAEIGANQWRIGQDISDDFNYPGNREKYYFDVLDMLDRGANLTQYTGPGHWNDYDMLIVGLNGESKQLVGTGASNVEYRTHFSLWSIVCSPLLIGSDIRSLSAYDLATLTNSDIIALNQDPLGIPAELVAEVGETQIYAKEMADGSMGIALLNRGSATADVTMSPRRDLTIPWDVYKMRDLWKGKDLGPYDIPFTVEVQPHEARVYRMWKCAPA
ncbi:glycoside hydrolase [Delitschia confertaspora ATCC 74209]|uniref:Alpha-galactosidase n=1 Tax=Delitschia confertaspora ATCC 74209 TaxID=1513339 RepID=A0A9P4JEH1_9PLEO|nr:glycoside hydrolase [Delitschia confertaspora ATCC 74209]